MSLGAYAVAVLDTPSMVSVFATSGVLRSSLIIFLLIVVCSDGGEQSTPYNMRGAGEYRGLFQQGNAQQQQASVLLVRSSVWITDNE
jgi:hypothetical protein